MELAATDVRLLGLGQVGKGSHIILEVHPAKLFEEPSLTNRKVIHPEALVASKGPGKFPFKFPQNPPGKVTGPFPPPLPLEICGEVIEFPS